METTGGTAAQLFEIYRGAESGIDISAYNDLRLKSAQMRQIRYGEEWNKQHPDQKIDIFKYANPDFSSLQMEIIRLGQQAGIDIDMYAFPYFDCNQMWEIYQGLLSGVNVKTYAVREFDHLQMQQIRLGLETNKDVLVYLDPVKSAAEMEKIRLGLPELTGKKKKPLRERIKAAVDALKGR